MQVADLHYSVSDGTCRDTNKKPCVGDVDTAKLIGEALDAEKPDLVVFSGDQLNGQGSSWDSKSVIAKFAAPVIDRKIPWVAIFGESGGAAKVWRKSEADLSRQSRFRDLGRSSLPDETAPEFALFAGGTWSKRSRRRREL